MEAETTCFSEVSQFGSLIPLENSGSMEKNQKLLVDVRDEKNPTRPRVHNTRVIAQEEKCPIFSDDFLG